MALVACGQQGSSPDVSRPPASQPQSAPEASEAVQDVTQVSLMLDWVPNVAHLGFMMAEVNGYYDDAGLDVTIVPGRGSRLATQVVASGAEDFGFADGAAVAAGISQGQPIKMVSGIFQGGALGLAYLCDAGIESPEDVEGKVIAGPAATTTWLALNAALSEVGLGEESYEKLVVDTQAKIPAVLGGQADAMTATTYDVGLQREAEAQGLEGCAISLADWGVATMGHGIIANVASIVSRPEVVQAFVDASMRGWEAAADDPVAARDALMELYPEEAPPAEDTDEGWEFIEPVLHTPNSEGQPLGWMAPEDWTFTLDLLEANEQLAERLPDSSYYTNEFFPDN